MYLNIFHFLLTLSVISIIVTFHELGHYFVARLNKVTVKEFSIGFGPTVFSYVDSRQTEWTFKALPLGGYVACQEHNANFIQKTFLYLGGPIGNAVFAILISFASSMYFGKPINKPVFQNQEIIKIESKDEQTVQLTFKNGETLESSIENIKENLSNKVSYEKMNMFSAIVYSIKYVYKMISLQVAGLVQTIKAGSLQLSGPLSIFKTTTKIASSYKVQYFLNWIIMLSIGLGVINLLPLPPLDGGRIAYEFISLFNKRAAELYINICIYLFVSLMIFVLFKDVQLIAKGIIC